MNHNITYSIIIPHKNTPGLLKRCLDSLPRRKDIQIIVVDDKSDKEKVNFERFPGLDENFVEVIFTKAGKGAGYARNVGLTIAVGKWLLFADADDFFAENFIDILDCYRDTDYDLIYFGFYGIDGLTKKENRIGIYYNALLKHSIRSENYDRYIFTNPNPWGKIVKHSIIKDNNIKFDETYAINDKMFSLKVAHHSQNILLVEQKIYFYELRQDSLIFKKSLPVEFDRLYVTIHTNNFLRSIGKSKYKAKILRRVIRLLNFKDMSFFYQGLKLLKGNYSSLIIESIVSILLSPYLFLKFLMKLFFRTKFGSEIELILRKRLLEYKS